MNLHGLYLVTSGGMLLSAIFIAIKYSNRHRARWLPGGVCGRQYDGQGSGTEPVNADGKRTPLGTIECGVVTCKNIDCFEFGKDVLMTPGAGAYVCACNRIYRPERTVKVRWLAEPDPPTRQRVHNGH